MMRWILELNLETPLKATLFSELRKPQWNRFCSCGLEILQICELNRLRTSPWPTRLSEDESLVYDSAEEVV